MPLPKSRFKHFLEGKPQPIQLSNFPHIARACGTCGHGVCLGIDMTPETNDPQKKRYVNAKCEKCGLPWAEYSQTQIEKE